MLLRITTRLAGKLREIPLSDMSGSAASPLEEWYSHLFTWDRSQYIILTNAHSLYAAVIYGRGIADTQKLIQSAMTILSETLRSDGLEDILNIISSYTKTITVSKTNSRSVLGSMNEMIFQAKAFLSYDPAIRLPELSRRLNNVLYRYNNDYRYPAEVIKELTI